MDRVGGTVTGPEKRGGEEKRKGSCPKTIKKRESQGGGGNEGPSGRESRQVYWGGKKSFTDN